MSIAVQRETKPIPIRALHERMGEVYHQPVRVHSFTNKRFTVNFRHFRKQVSQFVHVDDRSIYSLECRAADPICRGKFSAVMGSITKARPATTMFGDVDAARKFVFDLDGSCGYSYEREKLSFQKIDYPPWDMYFCHEHRYEFALVDFLRTTFGLDLEFDCVLFMQNTSQTWGSSWMYRDSAG